MGKHVDNMRAEDMPYLSPKRGPIHHKHMLRQAAMAQEIARITSLLESNPHGTAKLLSDIAAPPVIDLRD